MKIWKNKFLKQMIIVITVVFLIMNCVAPNYVYANKSNASIVLDISNVVIGAIGIIGTALGTAAAVAAAIPSGGMSLAAIPAILTAGGSAAALGAKITVGVMVAANSMDEGITNAPGNILNEFVTFVVSIADIIMGMLQSFMFDNIGLWTGVMISNKDDNLGAGLSGDEDSGSWLYAGEEDVEKLKNGQLSERGSAYFFVEREAIDDAGWLLGLGPTRDYEVPNILYSPENIFANKIAALDANFINPHQYTGVTSQDGEVNQQESLAATISPTIATWYRAIRNIAIVGLLSVLVYIGIRIVIGTVSEKAKYKERLQDWFVALCMIFFMHFIMAGIMMLSEKVIDLVNGAGNTGIIVQVSDGCIFRTTLTGYIRFFAQSNAWRIGMGYSIMYLVLVGITIRYTFIYLKRALYLAFFTVIAPMVALTYPLDKIKDSEAQAFNIWIKEYFINAIIQPIHLILFSVLVGSTMSLAIRNPIYGIVVLLFMPTAENWIKRMFKIDKAPLSATSLGDVAVLGSIFGMGKNMATGVVKGVTTTVGAVAEGGPKALGSGIWRSAIGAPFRALGSVAGSAVNSLRSGSGNSVEDTVNQSTEETVTNNNTTNNTIGEVLKSNEYEGGNAEDLYKMFENQDEAEERKRKQATDQIRNNLSILSDDMDWSTTLEVGPQGVQVPVMNFDDLDQNGGSSYTVENVQKLANNGSASSSANGTTGNSGTNTVTNNNVTNNETTTVESENDKAEMRDKTIKSITSGGPEKDIKDTINKGLASAVTGVAGAVAGVGFGAIGAGMAADSKMMLAGAVGGAHLASSATGELMKVGDTTFNNNVKVLVKDGITNKDIIKNTAQLGQRYNWSEDKMKKVAEMAEKYPNLAKDLDKQQEITKEFKDAGLKNDTLIKSAIKDVIRAQKGLDETNKNIKDQNKSDKNIKNWK